MPNDPLDFLNEPTPPPLPPQKKKGWRLVVVFIIASVLVVVAIVIAMAFAGQCNRDSIQIHYHRLLLDYPYNTGLHPGLWAYTMLSTEEKVWLEKHHLGYVNLWQAERPQIRNHAEKQEVEKQERQELALRHTIGDIDFDKLNAEEANNSIDKTSFQQTIVNEQFRQKIEQLKGSDVLLDFVVNDVTVNDGVFVVSFQYSQGSQPTFMNNYVTIGDRDFALHLKKGDVITVRGKFQGFVLPPQAPISIEQRPRQTLQLFCHGSMSWLPALEIVPIRYVKR